MALKVLVVLLVVAAAIGQAISYDLSGIHVNGSRFVNDAGQEVILKVQYIKVA